MSLFSENKTPWLTLVQQQAQPGQPAAGLFRLFLSAANKLQLIDSTGTVVNAATDGTNGTNGTDGIDGLPGVDGTNGTNGTNGVGVPAGGTTGQALVKNSNADYDTKWSAVAASGGGGGGGDGGGGGSGASGVAVPLTYVSNGDTNGLFYFIGQSLTGSWQNPQGMGTGQVTFAAYPAGIGTNNGSIGDLTGRNGSGLYLNQATPNGFQIDIGPGRALNPNNVTIQNRNGYDGTALQNVNLYGSQDGVNFTLLGNLPVDLNLQSSWATCAVAPQNQAFRYFRLLQNGNNNAGTQYFCCGQVEMYGTLYVGGGVTSQSNTPTIVQSVFGRGVGFNITLTNPPTAGNTLLFFGYGSNQGVSFPNNVVYIGGGQGNANSAQSLFVGTRVAAAGEAATNWNFGSSDWFNGAILEVSGVGGMTTANYGWGSINSTDVGAYLGLLSGSTLKLAVLEWDNAVDPTMYNLPPNLILQNNGKTANDGGNHCAAFWAWTGPSYMCSFTIPGVSRPTYLGVEVSGL